MTTLSLYPWATPTKIHYNDKIGRLLTLEQLQGNHRLKKL
jgi:hypothetical protein